MGSGFSLPLADKEHTFYMDFESTIKENKYLGKVYKKYEKSFADTTSTDQKVKYFIQRFLFIEDPERLAHIDSQEETIAELISMLLTRPTKQELGVLALELSEQLKIERGSIPIDTVESFETWMTLNQEILLNITTLNITLLSTAPRIFALLRNVSAVTQPRACRAITAINSQILFPRILQIVTY